MDQTELTVANFDQLLQPYDNSFIHYVPKHPTLLQDHKPSCIHLHCRVWKKDQECKHAKRLCLLIHGLCSMTYCWRKQIETLKRTHDVIVALDLPGFGYSSRDSDVQHHDLNRGYWSFELMKIIESQFCDQSTSRDWTLIGHSMGSKTVAAIVHVWKKSKSNLTTISNVVVVSGACHETKLSIWLNYWVLLIIRLMPLWMFNLGALVVLTGDFMSFLLLKLAYGLSPQKDDVTEYLKPIRMPNTIASLKSTLELITEQKGASVIEMNRCVKRVLLIWGEHDYIVSMERKGKVLYNFLREDEKVNAKEYASDHERVQFHIIDECGHCPMETHPDHFNAVIDAFLTHTNNE